VRSSWRGSRTRGPPSPIPWSSRRCPFWRRVHETAKHVEHAMARKRGRVDDRAAALLQVLRGGLGQEEEKIDFIATVLAPLVFTYVPIQLKCALAALLKSTSMRRCSRSAKSTSLWQPSIVLRSTGCSDVILPLAARTESTVSYALCTVASQPTTKAPSCGKRRPLRAQCCPRFQ
jgi:hypothetical protein